MENGILNQFILFLKDGDVNKVALWIARKENVNLTNIVLREVLNDKRWLRCRQTVINLIFFSSLSLKEILMISTY